MGGLFGTTLLILFPILLFNKTYKNTGKYSYVVIVNWVLFVISVVVGGLGVYEGASKIKGVEVLIVIN